MSNKKTVIAIVFLIIIILGLASFIVYDKVFIPKKEEATKTQIGEKEIDLNVFYGINDTLNKFNLAFNDNNSAYFGYLYSNKEITAKSFDKQAALYASIYNCLLNSKPTELVGEEVVKSNYEKIFGTNKEYTPETIKAGEKYNIVYDPNTKKYAHNFQIENSIISPEYLEENISTAIEKDKIIIKRKVFFVEYLTEDNGLTATKANIYTSSDKSKLVGTINLKNGYLNKKEVVGKYGSKLPTYTYTFIEQTINEYNFYSIKKDNR